MGKYNDFIRTFCLLITFSIFGQNQDKNKQIYMLVDNIVGIDNTGIYNGIEYKEKLRSLGKNHANFMSPDFIASTIEYDGQLYYNIDLKYDLYSQEVIARLKGKNATEAIIKLYNDKIESFTINNHRFVNLSSKGDNVSEFYEEAYSDNIFFLLIKHKKFKKDLYANNQMYVDYVVAKKEYLISSDNNYYELDSKKDITNLFPDSKQEINQFYRDNRSLRKTNYDQFLIKLLKDLKLTRLK